MPPVTVSSPPLPAALPLLGVLTLAFVPLAAAQVSSVDELRHPPLPQVEIPQPERFELANGMVVMVLEDRELPLVEARALIRTGGRWEPAGQVGLARLTGEVLRTGGTERLSGDELDDYLEDHAAIVETSIGVAAGSARVSCLRDDFPEVLRVFADLLRRPVFDPDKLEVAKTRMVAEIARQNDDATGILFRELRELVYDSASPYARRPTYASVAAIGRDDLVAWHARYFHPNHVVLGLVGDVETGPARRLVEEVFADWPRGPELSVPEATFRRQPRPGVFFVEKGDVNQSTIGVGHLGLVRNDPDYFAVEVMNEIFGGSPVARLFVRVRKQMGLAYTAMGLVGSEWDYPGYFVMWAGTRTETTAAALASLLAEARKMTRQPPTDEEVARARASILNSFVFNADSTREILRQQLTYEYYGYPRDWQERYRRGIEATTTAAVQAAAARTIRPQDFAILVVGRREGLDRPLSDFGAVEEIDVAIPEAPAPAAATAQDHDQDQARELIARVVRGLGGDQRLDALRSFDSTLDATAFTGQGPVRFKARTLIVFPDRLRKEMHYPFGTAASVLTAERAFEVTEEGVRELSAAERAQAERSLRRAPLQLLRQRRSEGFSATMTGTETVDGKLLRQVLVELAGDRITLGIDAEAGVIVTLTAHDQHPVTRAPGKVRQLFSDFRLVDGFTMPHSWLVTFNGEPLFELTTETMVFDGPVAAADFEMPQ